jgi:hypothetical protein
MEILFNICGGGLLLLGGILFIVFTVFVNKLIDHHRLPQYIELVESLKLISNKVDLWKPYKQLIFLLSTIIGSLFLFAWISFTIALIANPGLPNIYFYILVTYSCFASVVFLNYLKKAFLRFAEV